MTYKVRGRIKIDDLGTDKERYLTTYRFRHRGDAYLVYVQYHPQRDRYSVRVVRERTDELIFDTREHPELEEDMTQERDAMDWAREAIRDAGNRKNAPDG